MVYHDAAVLICRNALALFCAAGIAVSGPTISKDAISHCEGIECQRQSLKGIASASFSNLAMTGEITYSSARNDKCDIDTLIKTDLWRYLRAGINYLEASGKDVPIHYRHPGGKAYGPLALTSIAIKDVRQHYPLLSAYSESDVLADKRIYEKFAAAYAELLLKHYFKMNYYNMPKDEVFEALQKGWFLGPTLYKKGLPVIASRQKRAAEYIDSPTIII